MADSVDGSWAVSESNGVYSYRASSLGACPRALHAERVGMAPVLSVFDPLQKYFDAGNESEGQVIDELQEDGTWRIRDEQLEITIPVGKHAQIVGHIDGIALDTAGTPYLFETKNMGASTYRRFQLHGLEDFPKYQWQISAYMHGLGLDQCLFVVKSRDTGELAWQIIPAPFTLAQVKGRIMKIEAAVHTLGLPDCPAKADYPCPFAYLHEETRTHDGENVIDEFLDNLAGDYAEARDREKAAAADKAEAWARIQLHLEGRERVDTTRWTVGVTSSTRTSYDTRGIELEYPDVAEKFRVTKLVTSANVKRRGDQ